MNFKGKSRDEDPARQHRGRVGLVPEVSRRKGTKASLPGRVNNDLPAKFVTRCGFCAMAAPSCPMHGSMRSFAAFARAPIPAPTTALRGPPSVVIELMCGLSSRAESYVQRIHHVGISSKQVSHHGWPSHCGRLERPPALVARATEPEGTPATCARCQPDGGRVLLCERVRLNRL